jgi:hypothetical protein
MLAHTLNEHKIDIQTIINYGKNKRMNEQTDRLNIRQTDKQTDKR